MGLSELMGSTELQAGEERYYKSTMDAWAKIYHEEGPAAFFKVRLSTPHIRTPPPGAPAVSVLDDTHCCLHSTLLGLM